jgi:hypothetical protein
VTIQFHGLSDLLSLDIRKGILVIPNVVYTTSVVDLVCLQQLILGNTFVTCLSFQYHVSATQDSASRLRRSRVKKLNYAKEFSKYNHVRAFICNGFTHHGIICQLPYLAWPQPWESIETIVTYTLTT